MEYYSVCRKHEYPPFTSTAMELEGIMLSEISQAGKDNYHMVSLIMWNIRNSMEDIRRRKGKMKGWGESEGKMNHETLWTQGNKLRASEGRGIGGTG